MFNIITPTYNRQHLLHRVFDSLANQTFHDFKWIIIDDGSSDKTEELVTHWINSTDTFMIEYYRLPVNKGKPAAVNLGLTKCNYPFTIIADSDDTFLPNTLEDIKQKWNEIDQNENNVAAIWTLVVDENNQIIGDHFPEDNWRVDFNERVLNQKKQLEGEKWHCWRTDILKRFPLYHDSIAHIGESHTWNRINKVYDFLCINNYYRKMYITTDSLITSRKSKNALARASYYSGYYALKDVEPSQILSFPYYRAMAFEYAKSKFYYSDEHLKLSFLKYLTSIFIFLTQIPGRLLHKLP